MDSFSHRTDAIDAPKEKRAGAVDANYSFSILGSGTYLPRRRVGSSEIDRIAGLEEGTTSRRFSIDVRHWADSDETTSMMGAEAARLALEEAGMDASGLDVVIGACGVMEQPIPGTAILVQHRLGIGSSGIPCFDVNATCLSFLVALDRVLAGFALGEWKRALVVSSDIASAALDHGNPETTSIFGDGAAAFVLEAGGPHVRLATRLRSWGDGAEICRLEAGGTRLRPHEDLDAFMARSKFQMNGPALLRAAGRPFPGFVTDLLESAGTGVDDIDHVVPHQASSAALAFVKKAIPSGSSKVVDIFRETGNQIAASLPTALHVARRRGLLASGTKSLLVGSSAGISLGGAVVAW